MMVENTNERKRVGFLFGGRSSEHEISVITALQAITALDVTRYEPVPIYVDQQGVWHSGAALLERKFYTNLPANFSKVQEVTLLPTPGQRGVWVVERSQGQLHLVEELPVDVFIFSFHGQFGEDGCTQGLLELAQFPYSGCTVLPSAVAMNKAICKSTLSAHGIPVLPGMLVHKAEAMRDIEAVCREILATEALAHFPLFVKPCNLGSSIGIGKAGDLSELKTALARVFRYDLQALVEPCLTQMFEVNVSVLSGAQGPRVSVVEIPVASSGALTYEDKYLRGGGKKTGQAQGMASLTRMIDPPDLDQRCKDAVQALALSAYKLLGAAGVVRFDFMVETKTGRIYFNELNPLPGSMAFYLWAKSHPQVLYTEILNQLIAEAESNLQMKRSLETSMEFRALKG